MPQNNEDMRATKTIMGRAWRCFTCVPIANEKCLKYTMCVFVYIFMPHCFRSAFVYTLCHWWMALTNGLTQLYCFQRGLSEIGDGNTTVGGTYANVCVCAVATRVVETGV